MITKEENWKIKVEVENEQKFIFLKIKKINK